MVLLAEILKASRIVRLCVCVRVHAMHVQDPHKTCLDVSLLVGLSLACCWCVLIEAPAPGLSGAVGASRRRH